MCNCPPGFQVFGHQCIGNKSFKVMSRILLLCKLIYLNLIKEINECKHHNHTCFESNSICHNTLGSYECVCQEGFVMYKNFCHDINECNSIVKVCDEATQYCINTLGSFYCECKTGLVNYLHNGLVYCGDVNSGLSGHECKHGNFSFQVKYNKRN